MVGPRGCEIRSLSCVICKNSALTLLRHQFPPTVASMKQASSPLFLLLFLKQYIKRWRDSASLHSLFCSVCASPKLVRDEVVPSYGVCADFLNFQAVANRKIPVESCTGAANSDQLRIGLHPPWQFGRLEVQRLPRFALLDKGA